MSQLRDGVNYTLELLDWGVIDLNELSRLTGIDRTPLSRISSRHAKVDNITLRAAESIAAAGEYIKARSELVHKELEGLPRSQRISKSSWGSLDWPHGYEHTERFYKEMSLRASKRYDRLLTTVGEVLDAVDEIELP